MKREVQPAPASYLENPASPRRGFRRESGNAGCIADTKDAALGSPPTRVVRRESLQKFADAHYLSEAYADRHAGRGCVCVDYTAVP
jgi:hypothetical protein